MTLIDAPAPPSGRSVTARWITEVLAPPFTATATLLLLGFHATRMQGLRDAALAALFVAAIPYAVVIAGVLTGRWKDRMLTTRSQRYIPILSNIFFASIGLAIMLIGDAPPELAAFIAAVIGTQAFLYLINFAWKISFHAGGSAGMSVVLAYEFGSYLLAFLLPVVFLICWARVHLQEHTFAQVTAGVPVGGLVMGLLYHFALHGL